jgi:hypothetical protein
MLRHLRNFWIAWITTIVLAGFSNAAAPVSYKVTDLGVEGNDNLGCAMSVNNQSRLGGDHVWELATGAAG